MPKESFARWQSTTIQQLGYSINLILALSTAALGFGFELVQDCDFHPCCWTKVLFSLALLLLTLSIGLGVAGTINRLCDFRKTTSIAHDRERWREENVADVDNRLLARRNQARTLGDRTWNLFYGQITSFGAGIFLLISALGSIYRARLF